MEAASGQPVRARVHDRRPIAAARLLGSLERLVYRLARRAVRGTDLAPIHRLTIDVQRRALACALRSPANAKHPPFDPPDGGDHRGELHVEGHGDGGGGRGHPRAGPVTVDALRGDRQSLPVREQLAPALVTSSRRRWSRSRAGRSVGTDDVRQRDGHSDTIGLDPTSRACQGRLVRRREGLSPDAERDGARRLTVAPVASP